MGRKCKKIKRKNIKISVTTVMNKTILGKEDIILEYYNKLKLNNFIFYPMYKTNSNIKRKF